MLRVVSQDVVIEVRAVAEIRKKAKKRERAFSPKKCEARDTENKIK